MVVTPLQEPFPLADLTALLFQVGQDTDRQNLIPAPQQRARQAVKEKKQREPAVAGITVATAHNLSV
eukprot:m.37220 g.37220  ORF g.37220 m.37220 type:complete len:67 (-) comp9780_c0_seq2:225-425(-)